MNSVPVALFAYNRTDHLQQTLEGLRTNKIPLLYIFSDGPKNDDAVAKVCEVREILHRVDWCDVRIIEREENFGLGRSIRSGVSHVLYHHEQVIVVEDDIVLFPGAFQYTAEALHHYKNDPRVMTITMWSHPELVPDPECLGFFSKRFMCWGWATYRDAWKKYIGTPMQLYEECHRKELNVLQWGEDIKWQAENAEKRNLWYIGYALTHFLYNGLSLYPRDSLVQNIGFDGTGENSGSKEYMKNKHIIERQITIPDHWPQVFVHDHQADLFGAFYQLRKLTPIQRLRRHIGLKRRQIIKGIQEII